MGKRILVVDDAPMMRAMLAKVLANIGCDVVGEAGNGAEAVALAGDLTPDIVLLDIKMPVMNGLEALKAIKKARPKTTVVMLSSVDRSPLIDDCLLAGADDYIRKDGIDGLADRLRPYLR